MMVSHYKFISSASVLRCVAQASTCMFRSAGHIFFQIRSPLLSWFLADATLARPLIFFSRAPWLQSVYPLAFLRWFGASRSKRQGSSSFGFEQATWACPRVPGGPCPFCRIQHATQGINNLCQGSFDVYCASWRRINTATRRRALFWRSGRAWARPIHANDARSWPPEPLLSLCSGASML